MVHARQSQSHPREQSQALQRRLYLAAERHSGLARCRVNVVGKPYEGIPHVRFDVAGSGDQHFGARRHSLTLLAVAPGLSVHHVSEARGSFGTLAGTKCRNDEHEDEERDDLAPTL